MPVRRNPRVRPAYTRSWQLGGYLALIAWALAAMLPIWATLVGSFKDNLAITGSPLGIPHQILLSNYSGAWTGNISSVGPGSVQTLALRVFMLHSVIAVSLGVGLGVTAGTLAGYALARHAERLSPVNRYFVVLLAVPAVVTWVPLFSLAKALHLISHPAGLGLVYAAAVTPLVTILMRTYFSSFPLDLIEAAKVDGASELFVFTRIVLPMSRGVLIVVALVQAIFLWNELALAEILLIDPNSGTLPLGLLAYKGLIANLGPEFAALMMAIIPVIAVYLIAHRRITEGMRLGALR